MEKKISLDVMCVTALGFYADVTRKKISPQMAFSMMATLGATELLRRNGKSMASLKKSELKEFMNEIAIKMKSGDIPANAKMLTDLITKFTTEEVSDVSNKA